MQEGQDGGGAFGQALATKTSRITEIKAWQCYEPRILEIVRIGRKLMERLGCKTCNHANSMPQELTVLSKSSLSIQMQFWRPEFTRRMMHHNQIV